MKVEANPSPIPTAARARPNPLPNGLRTKVVSDNSVNYVGKPCSVPERPCGQPTFDSDVEHRLHQRFTLFTLRDRVDAEHGAQFFGALADTTVGRQGADLSSVHEEVIGETREKLLPDSLVEFDRKRDAGTEFP